MTAPRPEVWLRGPLPEVPALLQPVAHALLQAREEVEARKADELIWIGADVLRVAHVPRIAKHFGSEIRGSRQPRWERDRYASLGVRDMTRQAQQVKKGGCRP